MEEELMGEQGATRTSERDNSTADSGLLSRLRKPREARDSSKLLEHIYDSYKWLRIGMAVTAFAFPFLLWAVGKLHLRLVPARLHERVLLGIPRRWIPGASLVRRPHFRHRLLLDSVQGIFLLGGIGG